MIKFVVMTAIVALGVAGCAPSHRDGRAAALAERYAAGVERVVAAFDAVRDEASAIAAADAFVSWSEETMTVYAAQVRALSDAEKEALAAREAELSSVVRDIATRGMKKVYAYPNALRHLGERAQAINRRLMRRIG